MEITKTFNPDCLINIGHRIPTIKEEEALWYGLKNHILPRSVNDIGVKTAIETGILYKERHYIITKLTYWSNKTLNIKNFQRCQAIV